jgi:O-antigen/teichoic acid export membrane protein
MLRKFLTFSFGGWLAAAISFLTLPIVTALLRPDEFGKAAMFTLAVGLGSQIAQFGTDQAYARYYFAAEREGSTQALLRAALAVPVFLSLLVAAGIVLLGDRVGFWLFDAPNPLATGLLAFCLVLTVVERYSTMTLRMQQKAASYSALRLIASIVTFLVTVGYARLVAPDFVALCVAQTAAVLVTMFAGIALSAREWAPGPMDRARLHQVLAYGLPFVPAILVIWLFEGIDRIMLRHLAGFEELGLFSAAYRFVSLLALVQVSFSTFWLPVAFEMMEKEPEKARETYAVALRRAVPLLLGAGLALLMAKELIIMAFASDYRGALAVMPFLLLVPIMYALSEIAIGCIAFSNKNYWHIVIAALACLLNLVINSLLIPHIGARGAAIATGLAYALFFALRLHISRRLFPFPVELGRLWLATAGFAAACLANTLVPEAALAYGAIAAAGILVLLLYRAEIAAMGAEVLSRLSRTGA